MVNKKFVRLWAFHKNLLMSPLPTAHDMKVQESDLREWVVSEGMSLVQETQENTKPKGLLVCSEWCQRRLVSHRVRA